MRTNTEDGGRGAFSPHGRLSADRIADRLREASEPLEAQGADRFRAMAYRKAADTVRSL